MKILIVDSDIEFQESIIPVLQLSHEVTVVHTADYAIAKLKSSHYDLVIMDWMLPMKNGKCIIDWYHDNKDKLAGTKIWVNTMIPASRIKKFTNGNRIFIKHDPESQLVKEVQKL